MPTRTQQLTEDLLNRLKSEGFRLTGVRKKLVEFILSRNGHWTIQDLTKEAEKAVPGVGVATVYRTVALLTNLKVLSETHFNADPARYEVAPPHHHDHLRCLTCGDIFEFENEKIEALQEKVARELGFELVDHRMELYGNCLDPKCSRRKVRSR